MGVEIKVEDLTKSFGKQLIWGDVTLTVPAGRDLRDARPVRHRQVRAAQDPDRPAQARPGQRRHRGHRHRQLLREGPLRDPQAVRRAVPGRRDVRLDEPLRQRRLPAARAHQEVRVRDPRHRDGEDGPGRPPRRRGQAARRDLRRHAQARRPGPRPGARPRDRALRRARLRPRPGAHVVPQPADRRPQRPDRRDVPDRHPRHQHRPDRARTTSACSTTGTWRCSARARCCCPPRSRSSGSSSTPSGSARSACRRRRTPTSSRPRRTRSCRRCRRSRCSSSRPTASPAAASASRASGAARTASRRRPARSRRTCP